MVVSERALVPINGDVIDPDIRAATALEQRLQPVRNALGLAELTDGEMSLFAMVSHRMRLDPFAKQIYAIKRKGKVTFQVGIDGFRATAEDTGEYRGSDEPVFGEWVDKPYPHPMSATVVVHRQYPDGSRLSQSATAWWDEYVADPGQDFQWKKMPRVMLAKVAEAAAFRKAFPRTFGQVYEPAEMDQAAGDAPAAAQPVTTARERAAARLAAVTDAPAPSQEPAGDTPPSAVHAPEADASPHSGAPHEPVPPPASSGVESPSTGADATPPEVIEGQATDVAQCEAMSPYENPTRCGKAAGHRGHHANRDRETWS